MLGQLINEVSRLLLGVLLVSVLVKGKRELCELPANREIIFCASVRIYIARIVLVGLGKHRCGQILISIARAQLPRQQGLIVAQHLA